MKKSLFACFFIEYVCMVAFTNLSPLFFLPTDSAHFSISRQTNQKLKLKQKNKRQQQKQNTTKQKTNQNQNLKKKQIHQQNKNKTQYITHNTQ
jgi:hypothetical protein